MTHSADHIDPLAAERASPLRRSSLAIWLETDLMTVAGGIDLPAGPAQPHVNTPEHVGLVRHCWATIKRVLRRGRMRSVINSF